METKLYNDGINKMHAIIFDANEKLVEIVKEAFFTDVREVELNKYLRIGESDYDTIKRVALRKGGIYVYYPNYRKEYAWVRLTSLTPNKIVSVYKELCSQMLKNK
jgi:arginine deiminase